jgi:hypothetical protein
MVLPSVAAASLRCRKRGAGHPTNFAASLDEIAERDAAGKPTEIWFQMLWGRTLPPRLFKLAGVRNQIGEPAAMPSESTVHIAIELVSSWLIAARRKASRSEQRRHRWRRKNSVSAAVSPRRRRCGERDRLRLWWPNAAVFQVGRVSPGQRLVQEA